MKALILNSGVGKRMGDLTRERPKCLVSLKEGETVLSRQVEILLDNSIREIIITTGPFQEQIRVHLEERFPGVNFTYVHNPLYENTNYIYSLLLAKDFLEDELILMHGDLVFAPGLLKKTLEFAHANTVLVNPHVELPEKDFKARIQEGRVREISVNIFGKDCYFLIPLYKLSPGFTRSWFAEMERFAEAGKLKVYAEDALNGILAENHLYPLYFSGELCSEIDNGTDLEKVRKLLAAQ